MSIYKIEMEPRLPAGKESGPFTQTIKLTEGPRTMGIARWYTAGSPSGVSQLLELSIDPSIRRKGHGKTLLRAVMEQAVSLHKQRKIGARRIFINMHQKEQVIGRAFLMSCGFHHIATIPDMLIDEDLMVFVKSFD